MTVPRPMAAITLPRISLGTVSAIRAEQAGKKKALDTATAMRINSTATKPVE